MPLRRRDRGDRLDPPDQSSRSEPFNLLDELSRIHGHSAMFHDGPSAPVGPLKMAITF
jgi:hypothetical protein